MEENNLDNYFKEKLDGHTEEPSPAVWEGINSELPKAGFVWNKRYLILLLLLLSIGGAAFLGYRLYEVDNRMTQLEEKIKNEKSESNTQVEKTPTEGSDQSALENSLDNENSRSLENSLKESPISGKTESDLNRGSNAEESPKAENSIEIPAKTNDSAVSNESNSRNSQSASANLLLIPNQNREASEGESEFEEEIDFTAPNESMPTEKTALPSESESLFLEKNAPYKSSDAWIDNPTILSSIIPSAQVIPLFTLREREVDYFEKAGRSWFVYIYGMAGYTHRRIVATAEGAEGIPNRLDKVENGLITPGAGLQLSRELGESFRLSIGVEYNQWIQEGSYSASVSVSEIELVNNPATQNQEYNFEGEIFSSLGNSDFSSASTENPFNIGFETLSPTDQVAFEIDTRRRINYLSIPVTFEYVYNAYPFTFTAGAGLSINPVIGSSTEYSVPDSIPDLNFSVDQEFSGAYLSFHGGVAIEYGISERMSIRLNPVYRGWMTPIFENEAIRTVPFGVALRAGVVYQFGNK